MSRLVNAAGGAASTPITAVRRTTARGALAFCALISPTTARGCRRKSSTVKVSVAGVTLKLASPSPRSLTVDDACARACRRVRVRLARDDEYPAPDIVAVVAVIVTIVVVRRASAVNDDASTRRGAAITFFVFDTK